MGKDNNNSSGKEVSGVADLEDEREAYYPMSDVSVEIKGQRRILQRVPPQLREHKKNIYEPKFVSLGPLHCHRESHFKQLEEFKGELYNHYLNILGANKDKNFLTNKIVERIEEIRMFYRGVSDDVCKYKDKDLAEMMLRDGFFVVHFMEISTGNNEKAKPYFRRLGHFVGMCLARDMMMLENQIPFWLIKQIITSIYDGKVEEGEALVRKFFSVINFGDSDFSTRVPWDSWEEEEPLHLLEACRAILIKQNEVRSANSEFMLIRRLREIWRSLCVWEKRSKSSPSTFELLNSPFHSVTDLKAKGIHFEPSTHCIKDIKFNSHWFSGKLYLPIFFVDHSTDVFLSNTITLEIAPEVCVLSDCVVLSYVNFMKSLIEKPDDVEELQEKGIIFSSFRNDEEIMKIFKGIDTYGIDNVYVFDDVKKKINMHCKSKGKTWMVELIRTYFHSPWTAIALFATTFLLCLTVVQTYYTIHPRNNGN